jgi:hypothetical protein
MGDWASEGMKLQLANSSGGVLLKGGSPSWTLGTDAFFT